MSVACTVQTETFCWVCRICGKEGPWQTDPEQYPKGFVCDDVRGLRCKECQKKEKDEE